GVWACSTGADCEFCSGRSLVNCNITPLLAPRRSKPVPLLNIGRRRLTPNLEQVTCREPRVTPINSAISSRLFPLSTRFRICWILSGVNFVCLPRGSTWAVSSAVISGPSVHLFSVHLFCPATPAIIPFVVAPTAQPPCWAARKKTPRGQPGRRRQGHVRHFVRSPNRLWRTCRKSALFPHCCRIATLFLSSLDAALPFLACSIRARRCFRISDKKNIVSDKCHKLSFYFLHV